MKNALIAALVSLVVATASAGAATHSNDAQQVDQLRHAVAGLASQNALEGTAIRNLQAQVADLKAHDGEQDASLRWHEGQEQGTIDLYVNADARLQKLGLTFRDGQCLIQPGSGFCD